MIPVDLQLTSSVRTQSPALKGGHTLPDYFVCVCVGGVSLTSCVMLMIPEQTGSSKGFLLRQKEASWLHSTWFVVG